MCIYIYIYIYIYHAYEIKVASCKHFLYNIRNIIKNNIPNIIYSVK